MELNEEASLQYNSYMSKEDFITLMNKLNFEKVESADLDLITGCLINKEGEIKKLYYHIAIS